MLAAKAQNMVEVNDTAKLEFYRLGGGPDRLPGTGAALLRAGRPRDGDCRQRGDAAALPQNRRGDRRIQAGFSR